MLRLRVFLVACGMLLPAIGWAQGEDTDLFDDIAQDAPKKTDPEPEKKKRIELPKSEEPAKKKMKAPSKASKEKTPEVDLSKLDKIKAVPRKDVLKRHRFELSVAPGLSLNDAYWTHYSVAGSLIWYPHDAFGIGVGADYFYGRLRSSNQDVVRRSLTSVIAQFEQPELFAHLDFYWVPLYGKFSLFDTFIIHLDTYAIAGFGVATSFGSKQPPLVNGGIGQRIYLTDWLAMKFELRDYLFVDTFRINDQTNSDVQSYVMFYGGISAYLPPSFEYAAP